MALQSDGIMYKTRQPFQVLSNNEEKVDRPPAQKDLELLSYLQFEDSLTMAELAERVGMRAKTVQSKLARWLSTGVITRRAFIDTFLLGAIEFEIFFTPRSEGRDLNSELLKAIGGVTGVRWLYRTVGNHEFILGLEAASIQHVWKILEGLEAVVPGLFADMSVHSCLGYWWFGRKYLSDTGTFGARRYETLPAERPLVLDALDKRILEVLGSAEFCSGRALAERLSTPSSTVGYRVRALSESGVILGAPYLISAKWLGRFVYRVNVKLATSSEDTHRSILDWAQRNPLVVSMLRLLGGWSYSMRCEVDAPAQVSGLVEDLRSVFGASLTNVSTLALVSEMVLDFYPVREMVMTVDAVAC